MFRLHLDITLDISHVYLTAYTLLLLITLHSSLPLTKRKDIIFESTVLNPANTIIQRARTKGLMADRSGIDPRGVHRNLKPKSKKRSSSILKAWHS